MPHHETPLLRALLLSAGIALGWLVFGVASLGRYGIAIDSPALFYAGDRVVFALKHPRRAGVLDFGGAEPSGFHSDYGRQPAWDDPLHYPALPGIVGALTAEVFHARLGWLGNLDAHHLGLVLLHVFGIFCFTAYACLLLGNFSGVCAGVALALYPTAIEQAFTNPKDWPCALYYGAGMLAVGYAFISGRARHVLAAATLFGVSLGAKANAAFALLTIVLYAPLAWVLLYRGRERLSKKVIAAFAAAPLVSFSIFFVFWPWLYQGPASGWFRHLSDYVKFIAGFGRGSRMTFTLYPFKAVAVLSPPLVLLSATIYTILGGFRGTRQSAAVYWLHILWIGVVLGRIAAPGSNFYDGTRHFLEYIPALCSMAGAGAGLIARAAVTRFASLAKPWVVVPAAALALGSLILPVVRYHPYELAYFNVFAGGLGGAQRHQVLCQPPPQDYRACGTEGDYWFSSVREADRVLSHIVKPGQSVGWCGLWGWQFTLDWPKGAPAPAWGSIDGASYLLVVPRGCEATQQDLDANPLLRPLLFEARRGGGLIYRIYGPRYRWQS
jgi:hypothetical protein